MTKIKVNGKNIVVPSFAQIKARSQRVFLGKNDEKKGETIQCLLLDGLNHMIQHGNTSSLRQTLADARASRGSDVSPKLKLWIEQIAICKVTGSGDKLTVKYDRKRREDGENVSVKLAERTKYWDVQKPEPKQDVASVVYFKALKAVLAKAKAANADSGQIAAINTLINMNDPVGATLGVAMTAESTLIRAEATKH